uniref:Uncharacterized protein n=1 Tax=Hucho hucho TaxID=62062 RepID=A0A4W5MB90_9TELE
MSALYPPFSATASTVLWQLFSVVERQYRGDGLRCLIDFLLPAKRILQSIQQETCVRFHGRLFYHEGWPFCINEKVVLQLAPLHKVRLKQGDFYLQVVPLGRKAAKLVIKCLSASGQAIAEIPIPESMYGSVFTADFLQNVTRERNLHPLQNWLLTTGTVVYRTPWKNVVNPLFVSSTADAIMQTRGDSTGFRGQLSSCSTTGSTGTLDSHRSSHESLHSQGADSTFSEPAILSSPQTDRCRTLSFSTDLSNPNPRRPRHARDSVSFETRRLFRKSYMEALQNPMNLGSSSESILEEGPDPSTPTTQREQGALLGGDPDPPRHSPSTRSKSLERTNKAAQVKGHRARSSSGGSASSGVLSPKKLMNGYALRFGRLDLEAAFSSSDRRSSVREETVSADPPLSLPGNRDLSGRAVLQVCTRGRVWAGESCTAKDLTCLLGYYYSTLRSVSQPASRTQVSSALLPNALYSVLLLVDKETTSKPERDITTTELLTSLKALLKHIDSSQLTRDLDGTFAYDHDHWVTFRQVGIRSRYSRLKWHPISYVVHFYNSRDLYKPCCLSQRHLQNVFNIQIRSPAVP